MTTPNYYMAYRLINQMGPQHGERFVDYSMQSVGYGVLEYPADKQPTVIVRNGEVFVFTGAKEYMYDEAGTYKGDRFLFVLANHATL